MKTGDFIAAMTAPKAPTRRPRHVGFIPDGNRRWARRRGLSASAGYESGVAPGIQLIDRCLALEISEVSIYGFTQDNTRRPSEQSRAFRKACVDFALEVTKRGVSLLALGDATSPLFPDELRPYCGKRQKGGPLAVNLLVNYGWQWDLQTAMRAVSAAGRVSPDALPESLASAEVSRIDLIVRWGGMRRLSGFLPVQSVYADFYVVDDYWPDFQPEHFRRRADVVLQTGRDPRRLSPARDVRGSVLVICYSITFQPFLAR